ISTSNADNVSTIKQMIRHYELHNKTILRIVPNLGRDIGPLLSEFNNELLEYDLIGHFHTKKSVVLNDEQMMNNWVHFLLENLLGSRLMMADQIGVFFEKNPKIGLVFADDPHLMGWNKNKKFAEDLAN